MVMDAEETREDQQQICDECHQLSQVFVIDEHLYGENEHRKEQIFGELEAE
jgi:hypothetical protein